MPVTTPLSEPIVAEEVLLFQAPPGTASVSVMVEPVQTDDGPIIALGALLTVSVVMVRQPVGKV